MATQSDPNEEVLFVDKNGEQTYLPRKTGESLGYKTESDYTPAELKQVQQDGGESAFKNATLVVIGASSDSFDTLSLDEQKAIEPFKSQFANITFIEAPEGGESDSVALAIAVLNEQLDKDALQEHQLDALRDFTSELMAYEPLGIKVPQQEAQTGEPSLVDALNVIIPLIDAKKGLTKQQKESVTGHLNSLLEPADEKPNE